MGYPKTDKEYLAKLKLAASQRTAYWNQYPYNLGYYHADGHFSFDCVNLVKAILNGWDAVKQPGYFVSDLSRTGDCTEWGLLSQCEYSSNFSKMNCIAVLYMEGHIGSYLGPDGGVTINGHYYNCIEATGAWGGGVLYSFVDTSTGRRYNHRGGSQNGSWSHWGKMTKWLKYEEPKKMNFKDVKTDNPKYNAIKDCYDAGLINGYPDGTFKPKDYITREDVGVIISKLLKKLK